LYVSVTIRYRQSGLLAPELRLVAENAMAKKDGDKEKILAAIRRAAAELGREPSRGELRRNGSEPLSCAGGVQDLARCCAGGGAGTESEGREDQHGRYVVRSEEGGGEARKKTVACGV